MSKRTLKSERNSTPSRMYIGRDMIAGTHQYALFTHRPVHHPSEGLVKSPLPRSDRVELPNLVALAILGNRELAKYEAIQIDMTPSDESIVVAESSE